MNGPFEGPSQTHALWAWSISAGYTGQVNGLRPRAGSIVFACAWAAVGTNDEMAEGFFTYAVVADEAATTDR